MIESITATIPEVSSGIVWKDEFGVHYSTVFSYIKLYKEGKLEWVEL